MATLTTEWQNLGSADWTNIYSANMTLQGRYTTQDTNENKTNTEFRVVTGGTTSWRTYNGGANYKGSFSDSFNISTAPSYVAPGSVLMSISKPVKHNDDGTKSLSLGAEGYIVLNDGTHTFDISKVSITLPKINRRSVFSLSKSTFDIGEIIQATITQYVNAYHQNLYIVIGGNEVLIESNVTGTIDIETNLLANMIYQQIPNAKYYDSEFRLKTYDSNNNLIGTVAKTFRANVVDSNPLFDIAYEDTNATTTAITQNNQQLIQNNSTLRFKFTNAMAQHYATGLVSYAITINGVTRTGSISSSSLNVDWGTLNLSDNTNATVIVTDSRGFTTTKTVALTILEWYLPTAEITCNRQQNYYTETDIKVNSRYASLDSKNTITITYRIKKTSDSTWGNWNNLNDNTLTTFNADNLYSWDIQVKVQDAIGSTTYNIVLPLGMAILFIDRLLRSVGVNCFPKNSESLEVNGIDLSNTYSTNETVIGKWIDGSYIYRKVFQTGALSSGNLTINHGISNLNTVIKAYGFGKNTFNGAVTQYPIVKVSTGDINNQLGIDVTATQLTILKGNNVSMNTDTFVVLEYTKSV